MLITTQKNYEGEKEKKSQSSLVPILKGYAVFFTNFFFFANFPFPAKLRAVLIASWYDERNQTSSMQYAKNHELRKSSYKIRPLPAYSVFLFPNLLVKNIFNGQ